METKTIRFEKGTIHWPHHLPDVEGIEVFFDQTDNDWPRVKVIKSFTVQINIIEDEPVQPKFECYEIHVVQARMYGCKEQCKECEEEEVSKHKNKLIEDEES